MPDIRPSNMHPFFLNLERLPIAFVGTNNKSIKTISSIYKNSPENEILVFEENIPEALLQLEQEKKLKIFERKVTEEDFHTFALFIINTKDAEYEEEILKMAKGKPILLNVEGKQKISDFSLVSVIKKKSLKLGISSNDHSPEVQKRVNRIIENSIPSDIDEFISRLKFVQKNPLMDIGTELDELDRITADYLAEKGNQPIPYAEIDNLARVNKAVQRRANIYLGIIGVLVFLGIFSFMMFEFQLFPEIKEFLSRDNYIFYKMLAVGFTAEIVAGSMGMGYGVICTTILLLMNVAPPVVSASIHSAETFTSAAGSISHYKLKNVNKKLVKALAPPAILGAIIGAFALTYFGEHYAHIVKPIISCYTLYLGINILKNALKKKNEKVRKQKTTSNLSFLGLLGGFIDSFAGGGWGPLVTGTLMKDGRTPRYVVGSSTMSKFLLTITSAITFVFTIGIQHWNIVLGLLIGGIVTAPFSAMLTSKLPVKKMFIIIGCLVIVMSLITIGKAIF